MDVTAGLLCAAGMERCLFLNQNGEPKTQFLSVIG